MTKLGLSADEVLTTTRAVRKRLDLERPVPTDVIEECFDIALQAPTGSNGQNWRFVVVTDADKRRGLADIYRRAFDVYEHLEGINAATVYQGPDEDRLATQGRVMDSARYLADHLAEVPVHLIPCLPGRYENMPTSATSASMASVIPGAWSFMLAARERGLGTCWTTLHLFHEEEAADLLGIPFAEVTQLALIPVAYTKGTDFKPAKRVPQSEVVSWNGWETSSAP